MALKKQGKHGRKADEKDRKRRFTLSLNKKQKQLAAIIAVVVVMFGATYGHKIVTLKAENRALLQQQAELEEEKSRLTKELKNINSKDYIQEQAREKLRLLNKDEILFIFKDESDDENN